MPDGSTLKAGDRQRYAETRAALGSRGRPDVEKVIRFLETHARWDANERVEVGHNGSCSVVLPSPASGGRARGMHGAHRVLSAQLWSRNSGLPRGTPRKRARDDDSTSTRLKRLPGGVLSFDDGRTYYGARAGQMRGTDVHAQVCCYVNMPSAQFDVMYPKVDMMTRDVLVHLHTDKKLTLIHAEYLAFSARHGVATPVDIVAIDANRRPARLVLIELKTGYHGTNVFQAPLGKRRDAKCRAPSGFRHVDDTPLNRARSQILLAAALMSTRHADAAPPPVEGLVVHVTDGAVRSYGMGSELALTGSNRGAMATLVERYARSRQRNTTAKRKGAQRRRRVGSTSRRW